MFMGAGPWNLSWKILKKVGEGVEEVWNGYESYSEVNG